MRRLTTPDADLQDGVRAVLNQRLRRESSAPIALGLSGGGDSHALTLIAASWARQHGRRLIVLTVDHQLRPESRDWTRACAALAWRLGLEFHALKWTGDKPAQGLPAAARAARHRLLANAARDLGARVILLGHTASDLDEAVAMRTAGSTTPSPREWSPSPAWPEGRDVFLLRPMLTLRRMDIREWLVDQGETWIEDPSNSDLRFARARARAATPTEGAPLSGDLPGALADLARTAAVDPAGAISLPRMALASPEARKLIAAASLCAAGTAKPPRSDRLERLAAALRGPAPVTATLCGARIEADAHEVRFMRETGEIQRGGLAELWLHGAGVWDGRFEIRSPRPVRIVALAGHAASLPATERQALRPVPASARGGLPIIIVPDGAVTCPLLGAAGEVSVRSLVHDRLLAACGVVVSEP
ncbi:MAG: tRNA lysidine(34) synthetase TilS [Phenylobacterium sp.]|uniref:tRNA lysidine(34) synthetase TilS n=1 Tax=Phenylobacterium sp. TaxID=1871053 RepID=UPI0027226F32|nr:tRNA lysidine(34) synthetase TilS [Phenylobacterium sp.]MDO9429769.1 tRNA lysidine(34) synthetase TilS [Phenylobacterium sp.]